MSSVNDPVTILAIDPGYDRVGWAVGIKNRRQPSLVDLGLIQTAKDRLIFDRYQEIVIELNRLIKKHHPKELAIENLYFAKNTKTAMRVAEAKGVIIATALTHGLEVFEYDPSTIKQVVTGYGRADKLAVEKMVRLQLKLKDKLIDDTLDAAACYLTHILLDSNMW